MVREVVVEPRTVVVVVFSSSWWAMTVRDDGVVVPSSTTPSPQNAFLQFVRQAPGRVGFLSDTEKNPPRVASGLDRPRLMNR